VDVLQYSQIPPGPTLSTDNDRSNLARFERALEGLQVKTQRDRTPHSLALAHTPIDSLFSAPIHDGRKCYVVSVKSGGTDKPEKGYRLTWLALIQDQNKSPSFTSKGITFSWDRASHSKDFVTNTIAPKMAELLDRFPGEVRSNQGPLWKKMLVAAVESVTVPNQKITLAAVQAGVGSKLTLGKDAPTYYSISIPSIDPRSGDLNTKFNFSVAMVKIENVQVPSVPEHLVFSNTFERKGKGPKSTDSYDHLILDEDKGRHRTAVDLCKYMAWKLSGLIIDYETLKRLADDNLRVVAYGKSTFFIFMFSKSRNTKSLQDKEARMEAEELAMSQSTESAGP
jgi:hypothetical protein